MKRFEHQVAVITGGAAGIGFATARRICAEGGRAVLLDLSATDLEAAVTRLTHEGYECLGLRGDVALSDDCEAAVGMALEHWDRVDILVASAGIRAYGSALEATEDDWDRVLGVNVRGTANACVAAAEAMKECGTRGSLVLVSSIAAVQGRPGMPLYDASKAAMLSLTRSLAAELAEWGIRVNSVCPGYTVTEYHIRRGQAEGRTEAQLHSQPAGLFRRAARPDEVAAAIAFLASGDASYITATNLMVDAGSHAIG